MLDSEVVYVYLWKQLGSSALNITRTKELFMVDVDPPGVKRLSACIITTISILKARVYIWSAVGIKGFGKIIGLRECSTDTGRYQERYFCILYVNSI